jgi:hypothetical protein
MSDAAPQPTGAALDARARRLHKRSTRVELSAGGSYTLRKLTAGAISEAGVLLAGLAAAAEQDEDSVRLFTLQNLASFLPLLASAIIAEDDQPAQLSVEDVAELDFDDFMELVIALDFGDAGGAATAQRGFPADAAPAGVGAGGSDDPNRA